MRVAAAAGKAQKAKVVIQSRGFTGDMGTALGLMLNESEAVSGCAWGTPE